MSTCLVDIREQLPLDHGTFKLMDLKGPFVTPRGHLLPFADRFGWPHGRAYEAILKARNPSNSTRTTFRGLKFRRRFEALSMNELRILFTLQFHPYVLDVREQYGMYDSVVFWNAVGKDEFFLRSDLMTIDVIVTYVLPGSAKLRYHGISIKPADYSPDEGELRREQRERDALAERGWTWELMRGDVVSQREYGNNFMLYQPVADTEVLPTYDRALWFSRALLKSRATGPMDSVLGRLARRLGVSADSAQQLFSVGVAYGFLTVDHSKELRMDKPMHLIR